MTSKRSSLSATKVPVSKTVDDKHFPNLARPAPPEDRWSALRAYRKSKGLCFICGERWARDHRYKQEVQLHVVQEMLEYVQNMPCDVNDTEEESTCEVNVICISAASLGDVAAPAVSTMKLRVHLQGPKLIF